MVNLHKFSETIHSLIDATSQNMINDAGFGVCLPKIKPTASTDFINVDVNFRFQNDVCSFKISVPKSIYEGARNSKKIATIPMGVSENKALCDFHKSFIVDEAQKNIIRNLMNEFQKYKEKWKLTNDEYAELLITYVQNIPYDMPKYQRYDTNPRFLVETIVDNIGVCSDKSILLAGILAEAGFSVSLLSFKQEAHMTVGITVRKGYDYKNTGFASIETTCLSYVGEDINRFGPQIILKSMPLIVPVGTGELPYSRISDIKIILDTENELREKLTAANAQFKNRDNTISNINIAEYNEMLSLYQYLMKVRPNRKLAIEEIEKACV